MTTASTAPEKTEPPGLQTADVVVVGAGFSGLYALYRLRGLGLTVVCLEAGDGVGGTWYWNRYPGARVDIESMQYSYSFDDDLQQEWRWPEYFSPQADLEAYANHVADRFGLREMIRFGARVNRMRFDERTSRWQVSTERGDQITAKYVVAASGALNATNIPDFPGLGSFRGQWYHTSQWPKQDVPLRRPARRAHRHRVDRSPGRYGHREDRGAPVRLPAHARVHPAGQQPAAARGIRTGVEGALRAAPRGDAAELRRGVPAGPAVRIGLRLHPRGTNEDPRASLGPAQRPAVPAHLHRHDADPGGQRDHRRVHPRQDPPDRQGPGRRGDALPEDLPRGHQEDLHGHRLLRDVQPAERDARRRPGEPHHRDHPRWPADHRGAL